MEDEERLGEATPPEYPPQRPEGTPPEGEPPAFPPRQPPPSPGPAVPPEYPPPPQPAQAPPTQPPTAPAPEASPLEQLSRGPAGSTFDRFGTRARMAFVFAKEEATRFGHNYIGTEHILLGLLREGEHLADPNAPPMLLTGPAAGPRVPEREAFAVALLRRLDVDPQAVRDAVEGIIGRGDRPAVGESGLTPRAKRVIELALEEARLLPIGQYAGDVYGGRMMLTPQTVGVGTEHLLLGLVEEGEGIAAGVLRDFGVTGPKVRAQVLQFRPSSRLPRPPESSGAKNNVITCRLDDASLAALDDLIEAGIRTTRSDAAAWLIAAGIAAHRALFEQMSATIAEIRRLRAQAQAIANQTPPASPEPTS